MEQQPNGYFPRRFLSPKYFALGMVVMPAQSSVLVAAKLKNKSIQIPLEITGIQNLVNEFIKLMMQGNYLYKSFDIDPQEPNLEVKDVLPRLPYLDVEIKEDLGYFFEEDLLNRIQQLS